MAQLDWFKIWSSGGAICIVCKVGHQAALLVLLHCLRLPYWHYQLVLSWYLHQPSTLANFQTLPWIALLAFSVSIELVSSSARVTSVKSQKGV